MDIRALRPTDLAGLAGILRWAGVDRQPRLVSCYCRSFLISDPEQWDAACDAGLNREPMCAAIRSGTVDGMLARVDGDVVGWIHTGPVTRFNFSARFHDRADDEPDVAGIVCLLVAAPMRRRGVATALLRALSKRYATEASVAYARGRERRNRRGPRWSSSTVRVRSTCPRDSSRGRARPPHGDGAPLA